MALNPYKIVTIGDMGVGKTSLINNIIGDEFNPDVLSTIGASYVQCSFVIEDTTVTLNLWDTAGQERFQSLIPLYMRNADACVYVIDVKRDNNLDMLDSLYNSVINGPDQPRYNILCANKMDLVDDSFSTEEYEIWAKEKKMDFLTTSAKTGLNVDVLFKVIAKNVNTSVRKLDDMVSIEANVPKKKGCC